MTATAHLYRLIVDRSTGVPLVGASVSICQPGTTTPIASLLYSDYGLTIPVSNPSATLTGAIDVYFTPPQTVKVVAVLGSVTVSVDNLDVFPRAENVLTTTLPVTISNDPAPAALLQMTDATHAQWISPMSVGAVYTTVARPSAVTAGDGAYMYDTTLNKPIWSDGAIWRDAMGTAV